MKLSLGNIVVTPAAHAAISRQRQSDFLDRHASGDWGVIDDDNRAANRAAMNTGELILSAYPIDQSNPCKGFRENCCIWVMTEADRSHTTILLPSEYRNAELPNVGGEGDRNYIENADDSEGDKATRIFGRFARHTFLK